MDKLKALKILKLKIRQKQEEHAAGCAANPLDTELHENKALVFAARAEALETYEGEVEEGRTFKTRVLSALAFFLWLIKWGVFAFAIGAMMALGTNAVKNFYPAPVEEVRYFHEIVK